ncbi:MAG: DNA mismatch repair endonuclease MutL [Bacillota bacterium]
MADIKQLPPEVADQISAGEVIERPASVVKELVENSIDAESTKILIEVKNGGKDQIRVKDNGTGIKKENMEVAFSRYATSKIENINDIYSLRTLGFRGEALASIASVSKIKIISRYRDADSGQKMIIKSSNIIKKETAASPPGTDIEVNDLFFNTPARFKYMKTTNTEFGHISNVVIDEALAYPEIQFILKHNQKEVVNTPGTGNLKDTIFAIYGKELTDSLIPIDFSDNYIKIKGYIADPNFNRSSRIHEKFFVNKRAVKNLTISYGIENAYGRLLPPKKYPVVFLYIKLNPILVDVNVHPAKKEVKFSRNKIIQQVIKKGIKNRLQEIDSLPQFNITTNKNNTEKNETNNKKYNSNNEKETDMENKTKSKGRSSDNINSKVEYKQKKLNKTQELREKIDNETVSESTTGNSGNIIKKEKESDILYSEKNAKKNQEEQDTFTNKKINKILGQLHNTYIIIEAEDGMYIVDQHAAHERILYEEFQKKYNQETIRPQPLLVPINLELSPPETEIIQKYRTQLKDMGFILEDFGSNSFLIQEVPALIKQKSGKKVIKEMIDNLLDKGETLKRAEMIDGIITYMSCRTAVKAGDKLELPEMKNIIDDLFSTSNPSRCPHGRPALIHMNNNELEKGLGRK